MNEYLINFLYPKGTLLSNIACQGSSMLNGMIFIYSWGSGAQEYINKGWSFDIVDWAMAGWYPAYWEFVRACWYRGNDDWYKHVEEILSPDYENWLLYLQLSRQFAKTIALFLLPCSDVNDSIRFDSIRFDLELLDSI